MRHRRKINHLSRTSSHRKAMLANMACSLILHKRINTTVAKAKALRTYVEPLITKSKLSITTKTSKEEAMVWLKKRYIGKEAVTELFREISAKVVDREGGYTRIIKTGNRLGDNAEMCMMELVDYNENLLKDKATADSKAKRKRRGTKKKTEETPSVEAAVTEPGVDEVDEVEAKDQVEVSPEKSAADTEAKVDDKVEAPAEENQVKEEPVAEEKVEEPKAEVKTEEVVEEKKEDEEKTDSEEGEKKDKDESK